ncbi:phosphatase PAP2 family protein [Arvimicrobium flavum]|uniref:phosphatase PAP2 family protein n=1 Tax=Arvimicrobium flavum TaxID=3393320 RepID=UPI00237AC4F6|nr:phosphatase PAP2 family protein [Mesorhizobium shangrilense]
MSNSAGTGGLAKRAATSGFSWWGRELGTYAVIYMAILGLVAFTLFVSALQGVDFVPFLERYAQSAVSGCVLVGSMLLIAVCVKALVYDRSGSPLRAVVASLSAIVRSDMLWRYLFACAWLILMLAAFLYNKMMIPEVAPFSWDPTFARWDQVLFLGHSPWEVLHPMLGYPMITATLDLLYGLWGPMMFMFWAGAFASPRVPALLRARLWMSMILSWIVIGLVMATLLSSAGPCYFGDVVPGMTSPYAGLMQYLAEARSEPPLLAVIAQEYLWQGHIGNHDMPGGISAMPSMHNAQAVLFAAFAYRLDRRFGHAMTVFALLIFIGSIHLGWHYAVDGIVGAGAALAIWWICGAFAPKMFPNAFSAARPVNP